ncbi:hypothetical protein [Streptomyces avermitilis]|uniref:hypothetical protein n=1 Tax=Streptomyces avermitilis TaxID=33903 RepID=UPI003693F180
MSGESSPEGAGRRTSSKWKKKSIALASAGLAVIATAVLTYLGTIGAEKATEIFGNGFEMDVKTEGAELNIQVAQGESYCGGSGWVFPWDPSGKLANTPPGSGERRDGKTWDQDQAAFGGVPAGPLDIIITVSSESEKAIVLHDLKFHVEKKQPAVTGLYIPANACVAGLFYRAAVVNLTDSPPKWQPVDRLVEGTRTDPLKFPYKVTASAPELLMIRVDPKECRCKWWAELTWVAGSSSGKAVIKEHGQPFETTSAVGLPAFTWIGSERRVAPNWTDPQ